MSRFENACDGILTNEIYKNTFGLNTSQYKAVKGIDKTKRNLRDSMNPLELAITNLAEVASNEMHNENNSIGLEELKNDVVTASKITSKTKKELEEKLGRNITSKDNHKTLADKKRNNINRKIF